MLIPLKSHFQPHGVWEKEAKVSILGSGFGHSGSMVGSNCHAIWDSEAKIEFFFQSRISNLLKHIVTQLNLASVRKNCTLNNTLGLVTSHPWSYLIPQYVRERNIFGAASHSIIQPNKIIRIRVPCSNFSNVEAPWRPMPHLVEWKLTTPKFSPWSSVWHPLLY